MTWPFFLIHYEQLAATGPLVSSIDIAQRFQESNNAIYCNLATNSYSDVDDRLCSKSRD